MLHVTKFLRKVGFCYIVTSNVTAEAIENQGFLNICNIVTFITKD